MDAYPKSSYQELLTSYRELLTSYQDTKEALNQRRLKLKRQEATIHALLLILFVVSFAFLVTLMYAV